MNFSYTALTGSMGLTTVGSNNLTLSGNNSYYSVTTVNAGMLVVTNTGALPSFSNTTVLTVNNGGTLTLDAGGSGWTGANITTLVGSNNNGFAAGSTLGIDTSNAGISCGAIPGRMGLEKLGNEYAHSYDRQHFSGPTTIMGGTLALTNGGALKNSTLVAPTTGVGSVSFTGSSFTLGGLSGAGNLSLQNTASSIALTVGGNNGNTTYSGSMSGLGSLTKMGLGTLTLTGSNAVSGTAGVTIGAGEIAVASAGTLGTTTGGNLYVGYNSPGALTISDSAFVNVGGELDVNYQYAGAVLSSLTLTGGSASCGWPDRDGPHGIAGRCEQHQRHVLPDRRNGDARWGNYGRLQRDGGELYRDQRRSPQRQWRSVRGRQPDQ